MKMINKDIQFYHNQYEGMTYAVDVSFNRDDLLECIHHFDQEIAFQVGVSYVHPNDNYCKKTGREVSATKIKPVMLKLAGVNKPYDYSKLPGELDDNKLFLVFRGNGLELEFRVNSKSEKPHLIRVS